ncbi:MAG: zinc-dependent metalloprotease [candidate division Zixibacteria bacterium]|nr:zinc-dependent metalloprotease [candidate division Zixibacteria bacterium]
MRLKTFVFSLLTVSLVSWATSDVQAGRRVRTFGDQDKSKSSTDKPADKGKEKPFADLVKDRVLIEGLFDFYRDTIDNSMLMAIEPEQFDEIFLCGETRTAAEGGFFDNGAMGRSFPFYFQRVGKNIMMLEKNLRIRADTSSALHKAIPDGLSDHLFASTAVKSKPNDSTGAILINPAELFIRDAQHLGNVFSRAKMSFSFDKKNSYFGMVKSFPENSEIDVRLHYKGSKSFGASNMQNGYSFFHTFHYSLSSLPETDYVPRLADDRVGYFMTMYRDYSTLDNPSSYVRYIERWNLKKKNPDARMSEPVEPIVYWVENTVPEEYRDAVAEGIEFWNVAFEKIGFRNAIVAKQMPDTAEWDPADVRYSTVQWVIIPGGGYAVGPSRANPFTGQIYDADIRVSVDFIRYMFSNMEFFIDPVTPDADIPELPVDEYSHNEHFCNYGMESAREAAFGLTYAISTAGDLVDKDSLTKEYIHAYLVELVAHEVGHTLGFRHNYKGSTIYSLDQINDPEFTRKHGTVGSIMDYAAPNIAGPDRTQGEFYASVPGPYGDWCIEYGYSDFEDTTSEDEWPKLQEIAGRAADPLLAYSTDEDAFGSGTKGIDPMSLLFDLGDDPIAFCEHKIGLTRELWNNTMGQFEKEGESYQNVLRAFNTGWRSFFSSARFASRYVGGIYHNRFHVGDTTDVLPFCPVPADEQRQAVKFLKDNLFAPDAFDLPADLLNKLQPERLPDFNWSVYSIYQIDYPIHRQALAMQNRAISNLYAPHTLGRLVDNIERFAPGEEAYSIHDMFTEVRRSIWTEIIGPENVNSFRRQLQLSHLKRIIGIYLNDSWVYPSDARTLAANDLDVIETAVMNGTNNIGLDDMTKAHFKEVVRQIDAAQGARRSYK